MQALCAGYAVVATQLDGAVDYFSSATQHRLFRSAVKELRRALRSPVSRRSCYYHQVYLSHGELDILRWLTKTIAQDCEAEKLHQAQARAEAEASPNIWVHLQADIPPVKIAPDPTETIEFEEALASMVKQVYG